jgi:arsenate reductase
MKEEFRREQVLFVCTHNSARSQMAEGILRELYGDRFEAHSAGTIPTAVDPRAISAMAEVGIDISHHRSKSVSEFDGKDIDYFVTLWGDAKEVCPFFPGAKEYIHRGFVDPADKSEPEAVAAFRQVRDELKDWISRIFGQQKKEGVTGGMHFELSSE